MKGIPSSSKMQGAGGGGVAAVAAPFGTSSAVSPPLNSIDKPLARLIALRLCGWASVFAQVSPGPLSAPEGVGHQKYDESAASMIAISLTRFEESSARCARGAGLANRISYSDSTQTRQNLSRTSKDVDGQR